MFCLYMLSTVMMLSCFQPGEPKKLSRPQLVVIGKGLLDGQGLDRYRYVINAAASIWCRLLYHLSFFATISMNVCITFIEHLESSAFKFRLGSVYW